MEFFLGKHTTSHVVFLYTQVAEQPGSKLIFIRKYSATITYHHPLTPMEDYEAPLIGCTIVFVGHNHSGH